MTTEATEAVLVEAAARAESTEAVVEIDNAAVAAADAGRDTLITILMERNYTAAQIALASALERQVRRGECTMEIARERLKAAGVAVRMEPPPARRFRPGYNGKHEHAMKTALAEPVNLQAIFQPIWDRNGDGRTLIAAAAADDAGALAAVASDACMALAAMVVSVQQFLVDAPDTMSASDLDPLRILFALVKTQARLVRTPTLYATPIMTAALAKAVSFCNEYFGGNNNNNSASQSIDTWLEPLDAITLPMRQAAVFSCCGGSSLKRAEFEPAALLIDASLEEASLQDYVGGIERTLEAHADRLVCPRCNTRGNYVVARRAYSPARHLICVSGADGPLPPTLVLTQVGCAPARLVYHLVYLIEENEETHALRGSLALDEDATWCIVRAWYALDTSRVTQLVAVPSVSAEEQRVSSSSSADDASGEEEDEDGDHALEEDEEELRSLDDDDDD